MERSYERKGFTREVIKGVGCALIVTLVLVIIFALVLDLFGVPEGLIKPINQVIKLVSVFTGCLFAVRGEKGFLKGLLIGLIASLLSALIFGLISGAVSPLGILIDAVCSAVMGMISGAITVNIT